MLIFRVRVCGYTYCYCVETMFECVPITSLVDHTFCLNYRLQGTFLADMVDDEIHLSSRWVKVNET